MLGALGAAHLIDGLGQLRLDVVAVKRDLRLRQMLKRARQKRLAEVLADLRDLSGRSPVRLEILDELGFRRLVVGTPGERRKSAGKGPFPAKSTGRPPGIPRRCGAAKRVRATLVVREDDTFPAKSPGAGPGAQRRAAVEQRS